MFAIPRALLLNYESRLIQNNVPALQRAGFHKWLRYYVDFCINLNLPIDNPDSLKGFDQKLSDKQQSEENRQLARAAVTGEL